jgi:hypothetical protein
MGKLKPGASYTYKHVDGVVYARESGAPIQDRLIISYKYKDTTGLQIQNAELWQDIHRESKSNGVLRQAPKHVKILYQLSKHER